ncbi:MAG: hypothetical protein AAGG68_17955 [Bacteroidota bacterium]
MAKRTQISDYQKIEQADDLKRYVKDKRTQKRANKKKQNQRNRRYEKRMLRQIKEYGLGEED